MRGARLRPRSATTIISGQAYKTISIRLRSTYNHLISYFFSRLIRSIIAKGPQPFPCCRPKLRSKNGPVATNSRDIRLIPKWENILVSLKHVILPCNPILQRRLVTASRKQMHTSKRTLGMGRAGHIVPGGHFQPPGYSPQIFRLFYRNDIQSVCSGYHG